MRGLTLTGRVYLDYAATAPLRPEARAAMQAALDDFGNPSSVHQEGQRARHVLDTARRQVADLLSVRAERVVLTSGGTEANNLALRGVMAAQPGKRLLISAIEHDCVLRTAQALEAAGVPVSYVPVDGNGVVRLDALQAELAKGGVALVSLMHANNETGVIQPVAEAARLAHAAGALLHTDAVQTVGHVAVAADALGADLLTMSAHKLGGPKGAGALVVKPEAKLQALVTGGAQERNRRAGTENVMGIAGLGAAALAAAETLDAERVRVDGLVAELEAGLRGLPVVIVAEGAEKVPQVRQLLTPGRRGEDTVIALDVHGAAASQGAACSSGRVTASHVLEAMGHSAAEAGEGLRLSLGWASAAGDVEAGLAALRKVLG